jgi:hypothetical protein
VSSSKRNAGICRYSKWLLQYSVRFLKNSEMSDHSIMQYRILVFTGFGSIGVKHCRPYYSYMRNNTKCNVPSIYESLGWIWCNLVHENGLHNCYVSCWLRGAAESWRDENLRTFNGIITLGYPSPRIRFTNASKEGVCFRCFSASKWLIVYI